VGVLKLNNLKVDTLCQRQRRRKRRPWRSSRKSSSPRSPWRSRTTRGYRRTGRLAPEERARVRRPVPRGEEVAHESGGEGRGVRNQCEVVPGHARRRVCRERRRGSGESPGRPLEDDHDQTRGGIFEGAVVPADKIVALSMLPGKKDLLGMLVGTLNGVPAAFVRALNAMREKREPGTGNREPVATPAV